MKHSNYHLELCLLLILVNYKEKETRATRETRIFETFGNNVIFKNSGETFL